jgi:hypothetical protein
MRDSSLAHSHNPVRLRHVIHDLSDQKTCTSLMSIPSAVAILCSLESFTGPGVANTLDRIDTYVSHGVFHYRCCLHKWSSSAPFVPNPKEFLQTPQILNESLSNLLLEPFDFRFSSVANLWSSTRAYNQQTILPLLDPSWQNKHGSTWL